MKYLWAPWRIGYVRGKKPTGCILCTKPAENNDRENYILFRGKNNFVMLNAFPYNPGHLMVVPYRHTPAIDELNAEERNEHYELVSWCVRALREEARPEGFNIGANLGRVAGAGIEGHFHSHIVPRWNGDTNFVPVLSDTRVIPQSLADTYEALLKKF
jgi:ATP adenylyltransferase